MNPYDVIRRKRDGRELAAEELAGFLRAYAEDRVPEYQMAAFLMAVYFRGLSAAELDVMVEVMARSGPGIDLSAVPGVKVEKHSTGGVGDKVSLVVAPLVASLGVPVPLVSGRGLGHTGGTLDKLESIPGFRTHLDAEQYRRQLETIGCALIGQTADVAPLDGRLYALRDVTATVESIPLVAASIMSKKLAGGADALVLDIKRGSGAFLPELDRALELARTMIGIGEAAGMDVVALVTAMDRPLGYAVGNALEVEEAILALRGEGPPDLWEVTVALSAEMLVLGRAASDLAEARRLAEAALDDGRALERMRLVLEAQGGNPHVLDDPALLPHAPVRRVYEAVTDGYVTRVEPWQIGNAAVELGAGRTSLDSVIDPSVGFHITVKPGDRVARGEPLATVYARTREDAEAACATLDRAIAIADAPGEAPLPLISHRLTSAGLEELSVEPGGRNELAATNESAG